VTAFVIVCGPPGSGKSHLASRLGRALRLPVISKDLIKERLMDHLGATAEVGEAAFETQFAVARELLGAGTRFVLEGAFFRDQGALRELAAIGDAVVVEVTCDLDTLERRYTERHQRGDRHPGHRGLEALPDLRRRVTEGLYGVPDLNRPLLRVDSTAGFAPPEDEVFRWARAQLNASKVTLTETPALDHNLLEAWDEHAADWIRWAREPGFDTYWRFGRAAFLAMLPPPGRLTLDLGCGEGRVSRDLRAAGHRVVGLDGSPVLARAAREAETKVPVLVADAAHVPLVDAACDLVVAYMTIHDFDDMGSALMEASRVLTTGGVLCMGVVHPINSGGNFTGDEDDAALVIDRSYFESRKYVDRIERNGLKMTLSSRHHTLEDYCTSMVDAGFVIEAVREVTSPEGRWARVPMFLFIGAVKR